jgi:acyl carrier protein
MTPDKDEIKAMIKGAVINFDASGLKSDSRLSDQGMDSMDKMALLLAIEQKYGIRVTDEEGAKLDSIDAIADFIGRRTG